MSTAGSQPAEPDSPDAEPVVDEGQPVDRDEGRAGTASTPADTGTGGGDGGARRGRGPGVVIAIVAVVAVVIGALVLVLGNSSSDHEADSSGQVVGRSAPSLSATTTTGERFDLADQRGKWVLVNFFATWCPPCVAEHPELVAFSQRNKNAEVVSVAFDEPSDTIEKYFAEKGGNWPVVANDTGSIVLDYGVIKLPESFLVAPDGTVVAKLSGGVTAEGLEKTMAKYAGAHG